MTCPCVKRHSPAINVTVTHHRVPISWGGKRTRDNEIELCPNTHYLVHLRINEWRAAGGDPGPTRRYSTFVKDLARQAWEGADHSRELPRTVV